MDLSTNIFVKDKPSKSDPSHINITLKPFHISGIPTKHLREAFMFPPRLKITKPISCLLWGKPDTGKTTEATRLAITWARKGLPCPKTSCLHGCWVTADQYITYVMENQDLITNRINTAALLVVDDLFNTFTSPKTVVILDRLLRKFFQEERIVIVTSNRTPEAIRAIDAGLMSRFERWGKVCKAKGYK